MTIRGNPHILLSVTEGYKVVPDSGKDMLRRNKQTYSDLVLWY